MARKSKEKAIKEIIACGRDPIYFINNYAKIQHPVKGLLPFRTYHYQDDVVNAMLQHRFNIVLKARQLGLSTIVAAYIAWFILLHRDKNVLVVATKQETAKNMIRSVKIVFRHLPKWIKDVASIVVDNRHSIELDNGSRVKAVATSSDVGRSEAVSLLVVDECAIIPAFGEIWTGLEPVISTGGSVILLSTPKGTSNFFHDCYIKAKNNENNFNCKLGTYVNPNNPAEVYDDRLMWWVHPDHDQAWFDHVCRGKSPRDIAQERECNFLASGDTFVDAQTIQRLESQVVTPEKTHQLSKNIWIWEEPQKEGSYLIAADISRGDAYDYSAFHVLRRDVQPIEQVCEYKGKIRPDHLGIILMRLSEYYNNAIVAPENNSGWSGQTILKMEEAKFPHVFYTKRRVPKTKDVTSPDAYYAMMRNDYIAGYSVTSANRIPMLAKMEQYLRMGDIIVRSSRLLDELKTFIVKVTERGERPEAQKGYNDDLVMSLAGGLWVFEEAYVTHRSDEMTKAMLAGMSTSTTQTENFKDFNFSASPMDRARVQNYAEKQNKMVMGNGEEIDLNWLLTSG